MSRVEPLVLQVGDEKVLREWTRASSISAGLAQRARILLLAAQGCSNTEIGRLVAGLGLVKEPRASTNCGGLNVSSESGCSWSTEPPGRGLDRRTSTKGDTSMEFNCA